MRLALDPQMFYATHSDFDEVFVGEHFGADVEATHTSSTTTTSGR